MFSIVTPNFPFTLKFFFFFSYIMVQSIFFIYHGFQIPYCQKDVVFYFQRQKTSCGIKKSIFSIEYMGYIFSWKISKLSL